MRKLILQLKTFFYQLWNIRKVIKFKKFERDLKRGIRDQKIETALLIEEISKHIPKKIKKGKSEYIPLSITSKIKIKTMILNDYGAKMKLLNVKISDDLKFI